MLNSDIFDPFTPLKIGISKGYRYAIMSEEKAKELCKLSDHIQPYQAASLSSGLYGYYSGINIIIDNKMNDDDVLLSNVIPTYLQGGSYDNN